MELSAGTRLGPYEIVRAIGAGGMGVVYRANDTRLDRAVAVKVLPAELRGDADRMRRFEQEARTIGGLNHPNLVTLHDVGRHDNVPYLVTELLDGHSLRKKLSDGPVSMREAVQIATEIARGLAAAHGAGIVHRDIKPDNIFVTGDGRVKILDFGIAKLQRDTPQDLANAPTLGGGGTATGTGVVIGTPGYMAPEQLAGGDVDARTDVFAFGVVLYEMLARKRPFAAETGVEESYAVVKTPPPALPDGILPALERIVMRCLEKKRELRFQSAADLAFALDAFESAPTAATVKSKPEVSETTEPVRKVERRPFPVVPVVLAVAATVVVVAALMRGRATRPAFAQGTSSWPSLVEGGPAWHRVTFANEQKWFTRFAPDGKSILYSLRSGDEYHVVRTDVAHATVAPIANADGRLLDVSPSGVLALRQRMTDAHGGLLVTLVEGTGAPRERAENVHDATFVGEELAIVRDYGSGMAIESPIGKELLRRDGAVLDLLRASPDGTLLAFAEHPISTDTRGYVRIVDLTGREVARSANHADIDGIAWSPDGREVWTSNDLGLQAMDRHGAERMLLRSASDLFLRDVRRDNGWLLVAPRDVRIHTFIHRAADANDSAIGWRTATINAISRDGGTVAMLDGTGIDETPDGYQLYIRKGTATPVPIEHGFDIELVPDGSRAILLCGTEPRLRIVPTVARAGTPRPIALGPVERLDYSSFLEVSSDGKRVYAMAAAKGQAMRVWAFDLVGNADPTPVGPDHIDRHDEDTHARLRFAVSPDGKWLALPATKGVELVAMAGAGQLALPGEHSETPLGFTDDGGLLVWRTHGYPRPITRIEMAESHDRSIVMSFDPLERPEHVDAVAAGDGTTIAYDWWSVTSDLYILEQR